MGSKAFGGLNRRLKEKTAESRWFETTGQAPFGRAKAAYWKIKPANIPRWSKRCLGQELTPEEFVARPETARAVVTCVMGAVLREQYTASHDDEAVAVQRAAAWWMTGDPEQYQSDAARPYTQKVLRLYQQAQ